MLTRIANMLGFEKRATDERFAPDSWNRAIRPVAHASPSSVLSNLAVATRCVSLRSELLASVPLKVFRRLPDGSRERVSGTALADVLGDLANPLQTAFEAREFWVRSLDLYGNAFARIERDGAGQVSALWPLEASRVQIERLETGRLRYRYSGARGAVVLLQEEMLHVRASSEDGLVGRSPIAIARASLGLAISLSEVSGNLAATGLRPAGALEHPGKLSDNARKNLRESLREMAAGPANAGAPMILEEGTKWSPATFSAEDAELLESRRLSNEDIARIFGVPPASVGISNAVSYGSAQQAAADLVQNALAPLAARVEQAMQRCLLTSRTRRTLIIEHDLSGLLRGDATSRWTSYKTAREIGVMSAKEIRATENLGPMDPTDDYAPLRTTSQATEPPIATTKT